MIFDIVQVEKTLFDASFKIIKDGESIGAIRVHGKLNSNYGFINGIFNDIKFSLRHMSNDNTFLNPGIPFGVSVDKTGPGLIRSTTIGSKLFNRFNVQQLELDGLVYDTYSVGMGKEGNKKCIYQEDKQIALVESDSVVYDELYNFHVFAENERAALVSILTTIYTYTKSFFKQGELALSSISRNYALSLNKKLKEKYDPEFKRKIIDRFNDNVKNAIKTESLPKI